MSRFRTRGAYVVQFPLSEISGVLRYSSLDLHQDMEQHDLAVLTVRSRQDSYFASMYPGAPVVIDYTNRAGSSGRFVGYVARTTPTETSFDNLHERVVTCIAASREFRNTARNVWRNKTAPEIVKEIGKQVGFKVVTKQHGLRRKHISQAGDTYWELLVRLAKMTGYVLRAEGTTLYFLPLAQMVKAFSSTAPVVADTSMAGEMRLSLISMTTDVGNTSDDDEDSSDAAVVVGFGPNDSGPIEVREQPGSVVRARKATKAAYEKYSSGVVAHSRAEAKLLARGMADRGMLAHDARLVCQGDPMIAPYRPLYVASKDDVLAGYWVVKRVVHRFAGSHYECTVTVSTDEVTPQSQRPPVARYRNISAESQQGFSVFVGNKSVLRQLSPSPIHGNTFREDSRVAQWVAV